MAECFDRGEDEVGWLCKDSASSQEDLARRNLAGALRVIGTNKSFVAALQVISSPQKLTATLGTPRERAHEMTALARPPCLLHGRDCRLRRRQGKKGPDCQWPSALGCQCAVNFPEKLVNLGNLVLEQLNAWVDCKALRPMGGSYQVAQFDDRWQIERQGLAAARARGHDGCNGAGSSAQESLRRADLKGRESQSAPIFLEQAATKGLASGVPRRGTTQLADNVIFGDKPCREPPGACVYSVVRH